MPFSLLPKVIAPALTDVDGALLSRLGVELLMLDFDNTIVPYTTSVPTQEIERWLDWVKQSGVQVCVVSNSRKERVKVFCRHYGIDCITHARKPFSQGIRQCLERYGIQARQAAEGLRKLPGVQVFARPNLASQVGVLSFTAAGHDTETIGSQLGQRDIAVRAGLHCAPLAHRTAGTLDSGTVRLSFSHWNTAAEVERFLEAMRDILV